MQQKAVQLRFGQGVGALLLDGVLGSHDQEQGRQGIGFTAHRDLPLGHRFQQGRLHLGRRAVDFVRQHQVVEDGSLLEMEAGFLGTVDLGPRDVTRQQVGGELNTVEAAFQAVRQGLDGAGLGKPGSALHQQVPVRQQGDHESLHEV